MTVLPVFDSSSWLALFIRAIGERAGERVADRVGDEPHPSAQRCGYRRERRIRETCLSADHSSVCLPICLFINLSTIARSFFLFSSQFRRYSFVYIFTSDILFLCYCWCFCYRPLLPCACTALLPLVTGDNSV